ncbi:hypothetical protein SDC9_134979 [bioreactor metagenome]|uniref:Uncharacterized protein n=1 Tax=bioreactor metagenome TaxID=1076179 RepID=A0A645DF38_9ZZZZ
MAKSTLAHISIMLLKLFIAGCISFGAFVSKVTNCALVHSPVGMPSFKALAAKEAAILAPESMASF